MQLTNEVIASKEHFLDFINNYPSGIPICMLNIIKFKKHTEDGNTGEDGYNTYGKKVMPLIEKVGGQIVWIGNVKQTIIGDYSDQPDRVMVVSYPSKEAFIEMTTSKEYEAISHHRHESLVYGGLIATETMG